MINSTEFHRYVADNQSNICQMVVVQNDRKIINDTWNSYKADDTVHTMSVTKSIVSLLIGIAIEQGLIGSVDDYVLDYFPNYKIKRSYAAIGNSGNVINQSTKEIGSSSFWLFQANSA